ncbi:MAG: NAD(P)H-binding protein [Micromonosporaceae bacterium]|jgi:NAD(P)H dehydrogenase (quinone)
MTDRLIGVTGATGGVGGRVARRLADAGVRQRLLVRDLGRAPRLAGAEVARASYDDPAAMRRALRGVHTLFLVSAHEHPDRVGLHAGTVDAAVDAGVERIVYLSFLGASAEATFTFARDHFHTEQHIRATGVPFTFLRDSLYQDLLPTFAGRDGVIRGPAGNGRFAPVARDDVADVAVAVLRGDGHAGRTYDVTGPELLTMAEVAELITVAAGRPVRYLPETLAEAYESRAGYDAPHWAVTGWVTSYAAIAAGELEVVSDAVAEVAGHPPMSFAEFLAANPDSVAHLRS